MNKVKKYQEPSDKLNYTHNDTNLSNYEQFNKAWLEARKKKVAENAKEMGVMNNYALQQKRLDRVEQIPNYTLGESQYFPETHSFIINYNAAQNPVFYKNHVIHEKTHSQFRFFPWLAPQIRKLGSIINDTEDLKKTIDLYPRLQEIRYQFQINPNYKFNLDDIEYFRKNSKNAESEDVHDFLENYDNETILKMFNDVAYKNPNDNILNTTYAKDGAKLPSYLQYFNYGNR